MVGGYVLSNLVDCRMPIERLVFLVDGSRVFLIAVAQVRVGGARVEELGTIKGMNVIRDTILAQNGIGSSGACFLVI